MSTEFWLLIAFFVVANACVSGVAVRGYLKARREYKHATLPEVDRTGKTCRCHGHVVESWGTSCGWCPRCEHSITTGTGSVLYYGKFYKHVPPHDEEAEARTAAWAHSYVERSRDAFLNNDRDALDALDNERRQAFGLETPGGGGA